MMTNRQLVTRFLNKNNWRLNYNDYALRVGTKYLYYYDTSSESRCKMLLVDFIEENLICPEIL